MYFSFIKNTIVLLSVSQLVLYASLTSVCHLGGTGEDPHHPKANSLGTGNGKQCRSSLCSNHHPHYLCRKGTGSVSVMFINIATLTMYEGLNLEMERNGGSHEYT